jgi:hypothetical protein
MHGEGYFQWVDGRSYRGHYDNDRKHGLGCFSWPDGRKYDGEWNDGKQHGFGTFYDSKSAVGKMGVWDSGKREKWI